VTGDIMIPNIPIQCMAKTANNSIDTPILINWTRRLVNDPFYFQQ